MTTFTEKKNLSYKLHEWVQERAESGHALIWLMVVAFTESFIFPIPPDILLIPMVISTPHKAWRIALATSVASVFGGIIGYCIGFSFFNIIGENLIAFYGLKSSFLQFQLSIQKWGFWIISLKGLLPIPFKVVSICAGMTKLKFSIFVSAAVIARSMRFFALAFLVRQFGTKFADIFKQYFLIFVVTVLVVVCCGVSMIGWLCK